MSDRRSVFVITAYFSDMSSARILGVYESEQVARDIAAACKATAYGVMTVVVLDMTLNTIEDRDMRGDSMDGKSPAPADEESGR